MIDSEIHLPSNNTSFMCEICGYLIENSNDLKSHLKTHDNDEIKQVKIEDDKTKKCQLNEKKSEIELITNIKCEEDEFSPLSKNLPYRFIMDSNIYICNLCQCTYDSLRSIKAHLWKHSGHHSLSYPTINESMKNDLQTKEEIQKDLKLSPVQRRTGICSALLQVIEKLHGEELTCKIKNEVTSDCESDEKPRKYKRRYKRTGDAKESSMTISKLIKKESQEAIKCTILTNDELDSPETIDDIYRKELKVLSTSKKYLPLLISLATNDGNEQYVCGLCSYVCYHLPSLKSHLWSHVTNIKFNYSLNIQIINAAIDYENKLNRHLLTEAKLTSLNNNSNNNSKIPSDFFDYPLDSKNILKEQIHLVSFRCSKCSYSTIDLSILRLHKRDHYVQQPKTPTNT